MEYRLNESELDKSIIDIEKYFSSIVICDSPIAKHVSPLCLGNEIESSVVNYRSSRQIVENNTTENDCKISNSGCVNESSKTNHNDQTRVSTGTDSGKHLSNKETLETSNTARPEKDTQSKLLIQLAEAFNVCSCVDNSLSYIEDRDIKVSSDAQKICITFSQEPLSTEQEKDGPVDCIPEEDVTTMCAIYALHG